MAFHVRGLEGNGLPMMARAGSTSADIRVLWVEPTQEHSLENLLEFDYLQEPVLGPIGEPLKVTCKYRILELRPENLVTVDVQQNLEIGGEDSDDNVGLTTSPPIERLSEAFWIRVGEMRKLFETLFEVPVYVYVTDDGSFVVDCISPGGRAACIMRKGYAHLMLLIDEKMIDMIFEGDGALASEIEPEIRKALKK